MQDTLVSCILHPGSLIIRNLMILDRYIIKELVPNVLIGLLVFTFVMLMNQILVLAEALITRGVEFIKIFLIIYYSLPALVVLTVPMALLLGILLALGRLGGDSELTVMRASGISLYRLILPIFGFALVCWLLTTYLIRIAVPWGNYSLQRFMYQILTTNATSELKPRVFYNQFPGMVLYVQDMPSQGNDWRGVFIYDESKPEKPRILLARQGQIIPKGEKDLDLKLEEGSWHETNPRKPQDYTFVNFLQNVFPLPLPAQLSAANLPKSDRDQTVPELRKSIQQNKARKLPTAYLEVELYKKYSIPFACIVFALLATSLGMSSRKGGRSSAYAISIAIILVYYIFLIGGERFGDAGTAPPWLAAWAGNIAMGVLGLFLFVQANSNTIAKAFRKFRPPVRVAPPLPGGGIAFKRRKNVRIVIRIPKIPWRAFNLLDWYIVREFLKNFALILVALVLIAELIVATQLIDDVFRNKQTIGVLLQFLKFKLPEWIFYVLPVSAMTTTLVTFGMLSKNSEVIAMKSSGISLYRIALPVLIVAVLLSGLAFWLQDYILPPSNRRASDIRRQLVQGGMPDTFVTYERHWISGSDVFYNYDLFDLQKNTMYGFSIYQLDPENFSLKKRVYARQASYKDKDWYLSRGWERTFQRGKMKYQPFRIQKVNLPVNPEDFRNRQRSPSEMTLVELRQYISLIKERGYEYVRFAVDLQAKVSFPTVSLILTLIAIPFSFTTGKRGALYGIGISIAMGIVFWFFLALTKSLGYLEYLNPFLAAWTPNIVATLLALYLLFKLRT